jgi:hypothetical protein
MDAVHGADTTTKILSRSIVLIEMNKLSFT